jgi:hypothetical protein
VVAIFYINIYMYIRLYGPVIYAVLLPRLVLSVHSGHGRTTCYIYINRYIYIALNVRFPSWSQHFIYMYKYIFTSLRACNSSWIAASLVALNVQSGHGLITCYIYIFPLMYGSLRVRNFLYKYIYVYTSLRACNIRCVAASSSVYTRVMAALLAIYIYIYIYIYCA